jgi:hypothetical protein
MTLRRKRDTESSHRVLAIAVATLLAIVAIAALLPRKPVPAEPYLIPTLSTSSPGINASLALPALPV